MPFIDRNDGCVYTSDQYSGITLEPDNGELVVRVLAMILSLDFKQRGLLVPQRHGIFGSLFGLGERMPAIDQEETELSIEVGDTQLSSCLIRLAGDGYLGGRSMFPVGTTSWVHRADVLVNTSQSYHKGAAVVKFLWRRTARPPERGIYSMLKEMGVPNIPKVIFGGQVENCVVGEGFVCDILVLEACGGSINSYICSLAGEPATNIWRLLDVACGYIHTIYAAWSGRTHRFLHRDISSGNLLVDNNRARVIDWEYGLKVDVKAKRTDISSDPLTGTMVFASMEVLRESGFRSPVDDIESLFYVLAHAIEIAYPCGSKDQQDSSFSRLWNGNISVSELRDERTKWFCYSEKYLTRLGSRCPALWIYLLKSMYDILDIGKQVSLSGIILDSIGADECVQDLVKAFSPYLQEHSEASYHFNELLNFR
ncbi:hypothetical protein IWW48_003577 [Coemansia sp. RSA 1200]|nr:hypothetical protein IWW48_003577 [Coemansia sp. RSA 1200]